VSEARAATDELVDRGDGVATRIGEIDLHLFNEGTHHHLGRCLGAHPGRYRGQDGTWFGVWAPEAREVAVIGSFDGWQTPRPLSPRGLSGIWEGFVPGAACGHAYKYRLRSRHGGEPFDKADPLGARHEVPPNTASVIWAGTHPWRDTAWLSRRERAPRLSTPISIYEVHLGSWRRSVEQPGRLLGYRELAPLLCEHVLKLGFTHVELMPIMEHPFYASWGYQVTGYFAPTARYGAPEDLMALVDDLHAAGIGVILDWVPAHFPTDAHGPYGFDGSHLYEHADLRQGFHPHWTSAIWNYGRHEVRSFLISSALHFISAFHADGLRVDGVASMLYLDYGRGPGEWVANTYGGRENLEAIEFLRHLNDAIAAEAPGVLTFAEESTSWPGVTRPTHLGGLGFSYKWDMGWMNDTLRALARDPVFRSYHYHELTFRALYAGSERYVLPLSHDECVHGKGSLLGKMAGDEWQARANLRLLYADQFLMPGKKLLFMGGELGQWREWNHDESLDWHLLADPRHGGISLFVGELNRLYRELSALHQWDHDPRGFEWVDCNDVGECTLAWERRGEDGAVAVVILNLTPVVRHGHRLGVPAPGRWREVLNTDAVAFGGSGVGNAGYVEAQAAPLHGRPWSLSLTLPPLGALVLVPGAEGDDRER
jgi:1,4-alpha-glucan branching enzyme